MAKVSIVKWASLATHGPVTPSASYSWPLLCFIYSLVFLGAVLDLNWSTAAVMSVWLAWSPNSFSWYSKRIPEDAGPITNTPEIITIQNDFTTKVNTRPYQNNWWYQKSRYANELLTIIAFTKFVLELKMVILNKRSLAKRLKFSIMRQTALPITRCWNEIFSVFKSSTVCTFLTVLNALLPQRREHVQNTHKRQ